MANELHNAFDDAFNAASNGSDTNKAVEVSEKQDVATNQQELSNESDKNTADDDLQTPVTSDASEQPVRKRGRKKKDANNGVPSSDVGHFSCICDSKLIAQVRAIAWQEHMTVRAVVESMFTKCIAKYEKKHGPIQTEQNRHSDELF